MSSMRKGLPKNKMTDNDGGENERMRKRRLKTEVITITNVEHAVGTVSAALTLIYGHMLKHITRNGFEEGRRFRGKVYG